MSALANAALTKITAAGGIARNGDPTTGAVLWEGRAAGYLKRERRQVLSGGRQVDVRTDVFIILTSDGAPVLEAAGPDWEATTVTIEDLRIPASPAVQVFRVNAMEHRGAGTTIDSVRLELETPAAA